MARNKMFKSVLNTAKAHVRVIFKNVKQEATDNAEDLHGIELNVIKPDIKKIFKDLKDWNNNRNDESKLNRSEMMEIAKGIISESKQAIKDPENNVPDSDVEDMDAYFDSLEKDLNSMEWDDVEPSNESEENPGTVDEYLNSLKMPNNAVIGGVVLSLLFSINDNKFRNFLVHNIDEIKVVLGVVKYNKEIDSDEISDINAMCDSCVHEVLDNGMIDETSISENELTVILDEIEDKVVNDNFDIATNAAPVSTSIGLESDDNIVTNDFEASIKKDLLDLIRAYQRNNNFLLVVDKVMISLNKIISEYEDDSDEKLGLQILSKYELFWLITETLETSILDSVSLYVMFSVFVDEKNPLTKILDNVTLDIIKRLNNGDNI